MDTRNTDECKNLWSFLNETFLAVFVSFRAVKTSRYDRSLTLMLAVVLLSSVVIVLLSTITILHSYVYKHPNSNR